MFDLPYYQDKPSVTLQLQDNKKRWRYFKALIDSGADFSIFPSRTAIILGIDFKKLQHIEVEAADGHVFKAYHTSILAKVGNKIFRIKIGFVDNPQLTPAMGRAGFFETFKVEFDERKKVVKLKSHN